MAVRSVTAVAVVAAAAVVCALVRRRERRLRREVAAQRLMAGCAVRDTAALRGQVEVFRRRLAGAGLVPPPGGGPGAGPVRASGAAPSAGEGVGAGRSGPCSSLCVGRWPEGGSS